ncbi:hypothetical protein [Mesorhizobium salmacidum]|uniref:hypothetical protein n=1 Tax=Mesorhizobium salmacidum TaxID=3015171 RepID=UPI00301D542B
MSKPIAIVFGFLGCCIWYSPGFNGFFFPPSDVSVGDGRIISSILIAAAAILWCMNSSERT